MPSSPLTKQFPSMKGTTNQSMRFLGTVCHYDNTMTDKSLWQNNGKKVIFPCTVHAVDAVLQPQSLWVNSLTSEAVLWPLSLWSYSLTSEAILSLWSLWNHALTSEAILSSLSPQGYCLTSETILSPWSLWSYSPTSEPDAWARTDCMQVAPSATLMADCHYS